MCRNLREPAGELSAGVVDQGLALGGGGDEGSDGGVVERAWQVVRGAVETSDGVVREQRGRCYRIARGVEPRVDARGRESRRPLLAAPLARMAPRTPSTTASAYPSGNGRWAMKRR